MPLNMNTVGTGTGVDGSGCSSVTSYLASPDNTITYSDKHPAYYISDYDEITSTGNFTKIFEQKRFDPFVRLFTFKNQLYGISYITYAETSDGYNQLMDVTINTIDTSSSFIPTQVCKYQCYTNMSRETGYVGRNAEVWSSVFGLYTAIVQTDYIYFMDVIDETFMYDGSKDTTKVLYWSRFDGHTITHIQKLYIANTKHPDYSKYSSGYMYSVVDTFAPINRFNTEFLFHGMVYDAKDYIVSIDNNGNISAEECSFPRTVTVPRGSKYGQTASVAPYNLLIMEDTGFMVGRYHPYGAQVDVDSNEGLFRFTVERNRSSNKETFTISNTQFMYDFGGYRYYTHITYAYPIFNICTPGVVTIGGFVFSSSSGYGSSVIVYSNLYVPMVILYNPETKSVEYYKASDPISKNRSITGFASGECSTTVCYISPKSSKLLYVNSGIYNTEPFYALTGVATQNITLKVITNTSDSAISSITINAEQGDTVYCTRKITSYTVSNVNHAISGDSMKYKCTTNGTITITSNHGEEEYRPGWIWISASGYIKYIDSNIVNDTTINGNFIAGMTVGNTTISSSGHQNITVPSISANGLKIDMKGVH